MIFQQKSAILRGVAQTLARVTRAVFFEENSVIVMDYDTFVSAKCRESSKNHP